MSESGESKGKESKSSEILSYVIGYILAIALTGVSFGVVYWRALPSTAAFSLVLAMAFVQMIVHFRLFLQVGLSKPSRDELHVILFSGMVILIMVAGTMVILFNLRSRMM